MQQPANEHQNIDDMNDIIDQADEGDENVNMDGEIDGDKESMDNMEEDYHDPA